MQPAHDRYCDENHTLRQQCNDALASADLRASAPIEPASEKTPAAAPAAATVPDEQPLSSALREAIAIAQMPRPTPEVTREWERTAARMSGARDGADDATVGDGGSPRGGAIRSIAIVGLVLAATWLLVRSRRVQAQNAGT